MDQNLLTSNKKYALLIFFCITPFLVFAQDRLCAVLGSLSGENIITSSVITDTCKTRSSHFDLMRANYNFYFNNREYIFVKECNEYSIYLSLPKREERKNFYKVATGLAHTEGIRPILFDKKYNKCYLIENSTRMFEYKDESDTKIKFKVLFNCNIQTIVRLDERFDPVSAVLFSYMDVEHEKNGDMLAVRAYWSHNGNTYSRRIIKETADIDENIKDLTTMHLDKLLDFGFSEVLKSKYDIEVINRKENMFVAGHPIP